MTGVGIQVRHGGSGGGGGSSNSFSTIQPDSGTSPVADSATDTLTLTSASLDIAGNSGTDTISFELKANHKAEAISVLTQSGATFPAFVADRDFLHLVSGTGITAGVYGIVSNTGTTITLDIAPGTNATADKVFFVTRGHNFTVGTPMRAIGNPGLFPGGIMTGYTDLGAAQRRERITTGGSH